MLIQMIRERFIGEFLEGHHASCAMSQSCDQLSSSI